MKAYIFPGQGAQYEGMGKLLYASSDSAKSLFDRANEILQYYITDIMFNGTADDLKQTKVTQPAIFLYSVILAKTLNDFNPDVVAGHSLGEFSALVISNALSFDDGLRLVLKRALAMQQACELEPSTMAAIVGLEDQIVEDVCNSIDDIVVPANYNCPGQLVISGTIGGVDKACELLKEKGARRALKLNVGGAFHSPLMEPAKDELAKAIEETDIKTPNCPIYQNVTAQPTTDEKVIKKNLISQLTAPVNWTQTMKNMINDGVTSFNEVGPGKVLTGLVKKIDRKIETHNYSE